MTTIDEISTLLAPPGLICRGGFHCQPGDDVPVDGKTVVLVGNAGPDMWRRFSIDRPDTAAPLDNWTRLTLAPIAAALGVPVLFPFDGPPYLPFQRWAQRAESVYPSPLGPLIHPEFGLWHAYRAALIFAERLHLPTAEAQPSPCVSCKDQPCLNTCPVSAIGGEHLDAPVCAGHLNSGRGDDCLAAACLARRACPIGPDYRYAEAQARFHMAAFLTGYPAPTDDEDRPT